MEKPDNRFNYLSSVFKNQQCAILQQLTSDLLKYAIQINKLMWLITS
jgi:hypothetical protein